MQYFSHLSRPRPHICTDAGARLLQSASASGTAAVTTTASAAGPVPAPAPTVSSTARTTTASSQSHTTSVRNSASARTATGRTQPPQEIVNDADTRVGDVDDSDDDEEEGEKRRVPTLKEELLAYCLHHQHKLQIHLNTNLKSGERKAELEKLGNVSKRDTEANWYDLLI
jgi:hypothetical protein